MKGKKIIVPALAAMLGISGATVATVNNIKVFADNADYVGDTIAINGFVSSVKVGEEWTAPTAEGAEYTLTNSVGKSVKTQYAVDGQPNKYIFTSSGTYILQYTKTTNGVTTTSEPMYISVEQAEYDVAVLKNSQHVLPSTVAPNTTLTFAVPTTTYDGEEEKYYTVSEGTVSHNTIENRDVRISIYNQSNSLVYSSADHVGEAKVDSDGNVYFEYTPTTAGQYYVYYDILEGDSVQKRVSTNFAVKENFDSSTIELAMPEATKLSSTSIVLGKETTLPEAKVKDRTSGNYVDAYVVVTITHYNTDGTVDTDTVTDYKYTFEKAGDYTISYKASIPVFGIETEIAKSYSVKNVTDSTYPDVYIVNNYTVDDNGIITNVAGSEYSAEDLKDQDKLLEALGDLSYDIPSTVVLQGGKATVTIPAMFALDNVSDYNKIKYTRSIYNGSSLKQIDSEETLGQAVEYEFTQAGEYSVWFKAVDEANTSADKGTTRKITINVVEADDVDESARPTINTEVTNSTTSAVDKYVFAVPTATDQYDKMVKVTTEYQFDGDSSFVELTETNDNGKYEIPLQVGKSTLTIKITATADALTGEPRVTTMTRTIKLPSALAEGSNLAFDEDGTVANYLTNLTSANQDLLVEGQENLFEKGNIYLPAMTVSNNGTNDISMSVIVRDKDGNQKDVYNSFVTTSGNNKTIQGGYFNANAKGTYTVTYIAKETGVQNVDGVNRQVSNLVSKTFIININGITTNQIVISSWDSVSTIALNEHFDVPTADLYVDGVKVDVNDDTAEGEKYTTTWRLYQGPKYFESLEAYREHMGYDKQDETLTQTDLDNAYREWKEANPMNTPADISETGFTPVVEGTYYIEYVAYKDGTEIARLLKTVVAEDQRDYAIRFENESLYNKNYDSYDFDAEEKSPIAVPNITVYDKNDNNNNVMNCTVEVTCTNSSGKEQTSDNFYYNEETGDYRLIPSKNDTYTITYKVRNENGTPVVSDTWIVTVGDVSAPVLTFKDEDERNSVIKSEITLGEKFTLDTESLKDYVDEDKSAWDDITITVRMQDSSGNVINNTFNNADGEKHPTFSVTPSSTGDYTVYITLKDSVGNSKSYNYTVTVSDEEAGSTNVGTIVGTVLIVLSLILLGGVIAYFVVTGNKKNGKKSKKTNKK